MWKWFVSLVVLAALLALVQGCGFKIEAEDSCNFVQNSHKQRVSWNGKVPVVLYIHESVPENRRSAVEKAVQDWNDKMGGSAILKIGGVVNGYDQPSQDNSNIIYFRSEWDPNRPEEQGRTTVYWSGTQIFEADILVNAKNFEYSVEDDPEDDKVDLESLLVHEFGHVLGLSHVKNVESVMLRTLEKGTARRTPYDSDKKDLECEY